MRSPPALITPGEEARATYVLEFKLFIVKDRSLSFAKPLFPLSTPTFPCNWLNSAFCIIVIFRCFPRGLLSVKVNYEAFDKVQLCVLCNSQIMRKMIAFLLSLSYIWEQCIQKVLPTELGLTCFPLLAKKKCLDIWTVK